MYHKYNPQKFTKLAAMQRTPQAFRKATTRSAKVATKATIVHTYKKRLTISTSLPLLSRAAKITGRQYGLNTRGVEIVLTVLSEEGHTAGSIGKLYSGKTYTAERVRQLEAAGYITGKWSGKYAYILSPGIQGVQFFHDFKTNLSKLKRQLR